MVALTASNSSAPNWRAWASVVVGSVAAAALPVAVALAEQLQAVDLRDGLPAIPVAGVLGVVAWVLGTRARRRSDFMLGRVGGRGAGTVGRWLGITGVYLAVMAALAVGVYGLLTTLD